MHLNPRKFTPPLSRSLAFGLALVLGCGGAGLALWPEQPVYALVLALSVVSHGALYLAARRRAYVAKLEQLQLQHRHLAGAVDGLGEAIYIKDLNGVFLMINEVGAGLFHKRPEQIVGRHARTIFPAEAAVLIDRQDRQVLETKESAIWQVRIPGAVERWLERSLQPYFDATGELVGLLGVDRDMSAVKAAQQASLQQKLELERKVRERTQEFALLSEAIEHLVWILDPEGNSLHANERWAEYSGASVEAPVQWDQVIHPGDLQSARAAWARAAAEGESYGLEYRLKSRSGSYHWHLFNAVPVRSLDGRIVKWFGTATDIHAQKEAQRALYESQAHLQAVLLNAPVVLWAIDTEGFFVMSEGKGLEVLGLQPGQAVGASVFTMYAEEPKVLAMVRRALGGETSTEEAHVGEAWFETHYAPMRGVNGQVTGAVCLSLDITAMKASEAASATSARLSSIIKTQQDIATAGLDTYRIMEIIVDRIRGIVDADGAVVEMKEADELVFKAASGPAQSALGARLPLHHSISGLCLSSGTGLICHDARTDERIRGAMTERLGMRSMILVPLVYEGQKVGVLKAYSGQAHAFAEGHFNTLKLMAGLLSAAMGQATEFAAKKQAILNLLATERALVAACEAAVKAAQTKSDKAVPSARILVAENNAVNQLVIMTLLQKMGYDAHAVADGRAALAALSGENGRFDLVLMACQMPDIDGCEATRQIRQGSATHRQVPIIALSANVLQQDAERCLRSGMQGFLGKPLVHSQLEALLKTWLADQIRAA